MNAIRSEKIEQLEPEVEGEYAAASEVEAGIRKFVRNDSSSRRVTVHRRLRDEELRQAEYYAGGQED